MITWLNTEQLTSGVCQVSRQSYWTQLERIVKRTGEELLAAKDYLEFIRLLRCFIEMQEPKIDRGTHFIAPEGTFLSVTRRVT